VLYSDAQRYHDLAHPLAIEERAAWRLPHAKEEILAILELRRDTPTAARTVVELWPGTKVGDWGRGEAGTAGRTGLGQRGERASGYPRPGRSGAETGLTSRCRAEPRSRRADAAARVAGQGGPCHAGGALPAGRARHARVPPDPAGRPLAAQGTMAPPRATGRRSTRSAFRRSAGRPARPILRRLVRSRLRALLQEGAQG
jgi:hypothetical protein